MKTPPLSLFSGRAAAALAICAVLSFAPTGLAQTKVTSVEGITEYRLDNGLKVLLFPDSSKPEGDGECHVSGGVAL